MKELVEVSIIFAGAPSCFAGRVAQILREELQLRASLQAQIYRNTMKHGFSFIIGEDTALLEQFPDYHRHVSQLTPAGSEGFRIAVLADAVVVAGTDARGCLYGMAHTLRKMYLKPGHAALTDELQSVSITPKYPLRGHQLAYRDKQNTCPAWTLNDFDRYIRDLAFFGSNAIEILPPRTDDTPFSPLFKEHPLEMMAHLSELIRSYGMDVWVWYPNMGADYHDPVKRQEELAEREIVFSTVPYIDAVLIPAGDPGDLLPKELFPVAAESSQILHKYHPNATVWIAPQVFAPIPTWHEDFYQELSREPDWLYGVCFAPWMYETLPEFQARVPEKYKMRIRHYPDITHNSSSQFEVPGWDLPFQLFNGRESYNARPRAMKLIHNLHAPYTIGSLTYCEGIHCDVNKMVWGDQDFCPERSVEETLRDYVRLFIDPDLTDELSALILSFEDSWVGYARDNENIDRVYEAFRMLDTRVDMRIQANYRYKMAYLRAITDYQAKHRGIYDESLEARAYNALREADTLGADAAMQKAQDILNLSMDEPVNDELNHQMQRFADELYETPGCRIQLTTTYHHGQLWIRGAYQDAIHMPLNDHQFLTQHFRRIRRLPSEAEKRIEIHWLLNRENPGEGGQYHCLGDLDTFKAHVLSDHCYAEDPGFLRSPVINCDPYGIMMHFHANRHWHNEYPISKNWIRRARTIYGTPLRARFEGLNPSARYLLRVTYPDLLDMPSSKTFAAKLYAGGMLIHDRVAYRKETNHYPIYEYELPREATQSGELLLTWQTYGTLNRMSVSEVFITPQSDCAESEGLT